MKTAPAIDQAMQQAIEDGVFPAAELLVGTPSGIAYHQRFGDCNPTSLFDIASLTKAISTTTLCMMAVAEKKLTLSDFLVNRVSIPQHTSHDAIQLHHLLHHRSGLPAHRKYYLEMPVDEIASPQGKEWILNACSREPCEQAAGNNVVYSDIGFMLLGRVLEESYHQELDISFRKRISEPLGLSHTSFHPATELALPTEDCPWRKRLVKGENRDENCFAMGGVAGHSGLFSTALDIHRFSGALVAAYNGDDAWLNPQVVREFLESKPRPLGWDAPESINSAAGSHFSVRTIGHLGFTGCSLWIDLERSQWVILLTNRTYPNVSNDKIRHFRPQLHDLVWAVFS